MKIIKQQYISTLCVLLSLVSCQLAEEIEDFEPLNSLPADIAISDQTKAELALTGMYAGFYTEAQNQNTIFFVPSAFYGTAIPSRATDQETNGWSLNRPSVTSSEQYTSGGYSGLYNVILRSNWIIKGVTNNLTDADFDSPTRRSEIVAEAKAMRATCNFYLLCYFGEFYNTSSTFGIALKTENNTEEVNPRNTVAEVYEQIEADLDDAIANAPNNPRKIFINKTYAKGLKARVKLYQGDYAEAAALALDVIENSDANFDLSTPYSVIFDNTSSALHDTNEILFDTKSAPGSEGIGASLSVSWIGILSINPLFVDSVQNETITISGQEINIDGDRASSLLVPAFFGAFNGKYANSFGGETDEMIIHMRMAEVYLILAEADARANSSVTTTALDALNAVRLRAGATSSGGDGFEIYPESITLNQFLDAVRKEKLVELFAEIGQEWHDLVRYAYIDGGFESGFKVSDIKDTATNPNFFILPIPQSSISAANGVVEQNPGY